MPIITTNTGSITESIETFVTLIYLRHSNISNISSAVQITVIPKRLNHYPELYDTIKLSSINVAIEEMAAHSIQTINAEEVKFGKWVESAALFIMPGGANIPYTKKLNGKGNAVIKEYVKNGGSFLGICAGAHYASAYVEFDKDGELQVLCSRELQFFAGTSVGPIRIDWLTVGSMNTTGPFF